jgi:hypothetical protein
MKMIKLLKKNFAEFIARPCGIRMSNVLLVIGEWATMLDTRYSILAERRATSIENRKSSIGL